MAEHTPGPWEVFGASVDYARILPDNWVAVGITDSSGHTGTMRSGALAYSHRDNAPLIAAAPDMLAALEEAVDTVGHAKDCARRAHGAAECTCWRAMAIAAIDKAAN